MKTEIIKIKGDWQEVVNDCRTTVGKGELGKDPGRDFKRGILIAEHSPIRDISIKWRWRHIKSWIVTHWVRHKWEKFVRSQRDDRTGIPRDDLPQGQLVEMVGEANAQHLIDTWRKRLCKMAHRETRAYAEDLKVALGDVEPEIADVLVPNCIYRGGCPEMVTCGEYDRFLAWCNKHFITDIPYRNIQGRYDVYNRYFREVISKNDVPK